VIDDETKSLNHQITGSPDPRVTGSPDLLLVGRVARAHGNKGQVIVNPETDFPEERFAAGHVLVVEQQGRTVERRIASVRFHQGRPVLGLEGVATMDDADALAGAELKVPAAELAPLPEQTYYRHDLVGCEVRTTGGAVVGNVAGVEGPLERSLLVVASPRGEVMIPMIDGIVARVDVAKRQIVVDPPDGLIDVNLTARTSDSE
jgi:16S rRNA processing protein RimM